MSTREAMKQMGVLCKAALIFCQTEKSESDEEKRELKRRREMKR